MKPTLPISIVVASASFAITWLLAGQSTRTDRESTPITTPPPRRAAEVPSVSEKKERPRIPVNHRPSDDYRTSWANLASRRLSKQDRMRVQAEIFNAWAETDLEAAIEAALELPWDGDTIPSTMVMVDRCEDVWKLIQKDRFGPLGSTLLLESWANTLGAKDPTMLLGYLHKMKGIELHYSLRALVQQVGKKEDAAKIRDALVGQTHLSAGDRLLFEEAISQLEGFIEAGAIYHR